MPAILASLARIVPWVASYFALEMIIPDPPKPKPKPLDPVANQLSAWVPAWLIRPLIGGVVLAGILWAMVRFVPKFKTKYLPK